MRVQTGKDQEAAAIRTMKIHVRRAARRSVRRRADRKRAVIITNSHLETKRTSVSTWRMPHQLRHMLLRDRLDEGFDFSARCRS